MKKHWTNPGNVSLGNVSTTSETAFQRAIYFLLSSHLEGVGDVQWLDLELPVDKERKGRGHCIDLIGRAEDKSMVICELKFGMPGNGDPNEAKKQLLEYYEAVKANYEKLDEGDSLHHLNALKNGHFYWEEIASASTRLVIAANDDYWAYWRRRGILPPDGVDCYKLNVPTKFFKELKAESKEQKYRPVISVRDWFLV